MDEAPNTGAPAADSDPDLAGGPEVSCSLDGDVATIGVTGELSEQARKPVVRVVTDLLLTTATLRGLRLDLRGVRYANSAGLALLVQVQKMAQPRGVEVVLVEPPSVVVRPLQISGLWHRFPIEDPAGDRPARH